MWLDIGIVALLITGVYCFGVLTGFQTRLLTRRSERRAEDMYGQYAESRHRQRRPAGGYGGTGPDGDVYRAQQRR